MQSRRDVVAGIYVIINEILDVDPEHGTSLVFSDNSRDSRKSGRFFSCCDYGNCAHFATHLVENGSDLRAEIGIARTLEVEELHPDRIVFGAPCFAEQSWHPLRIDELKQRNQSIFRRATNRTKLSCFTFEDRNICV
ncbi:hypothetical protein HMPREF2757_02540 [Brevibacterium sp. HMSC063G07]|nr:hypothetical protein HMPREF2757_02540 [Brevibacterium sp. HMSC063G07]